MQERAEVNQILGIDSRVVLPEDAGLCPELDLSDRPTWPIVGALYHAPSPILGQTELEGFHVSAGWGTYGFKAAPIVGTTLAELVATGETPELIAPFALERFHTDTFVFEFAVAAVSD